MKEHLTPEEFVKLAREMRRDEQVPYTFEKRVMANLSTPITADALTQWAGALWRAVAPCVAITAIAALVSFSQATETPSDLDAALENAVLTPPEPTLDFEA
ncbi:MAG TPA: hypothetical protein VM680_11915 [Verrucomicrobiae bacterium]|nr:hypothetical protein [Verrucomicrobiae bacterium]